MKDDEKTKEQLVIELKKLRLQNTELEKTIALGKVADLLAKENIHYAESIVETVRGPLLVLDANLKIISVNRNFYTTFKVNPGETIGKFIYDLGNKQWDIPKLRELLEEILPKKEAFDGFEVEHIFQDIGHKIMLLNARQIYRKDIDSKIILLAIEDITEHKRLDDLLKEAEKRYRNVFETANDGIVLFEKSEGKITHTNQAIEKMLGYSLEESVGKKLQDIGIVNIDDFQTLMKILDEIGITHYTDVPIKTKSGQYIDTDIYLADRAKLVQCNIRDISDRKLAEETLKERENKYRLLADNIHDVIFVLDMNLKYTYISPSVKVLRGYEPEEVLKQLSIEQTLTPSSNDLAMRTFSEIMEQEKTGRIEISMSRTLELEMMRKDETTVWTEVKFSFIRDEDQQPVGILGVTRDITERKQEEVKLQQTIERLRKAVDTTIQVMVAAVEIRDPYTAGHQIRSAGLARAIATDMRLSQDKIEGIRVAASIHDIGKLSIPSEILSKPTKLSEIEFLLIKEHALHGYEILKNVESPWPLAEIIYQHHERMDGSGYPRKLKIEEILMEARILAVADVVEAMASHRPYRPAKGIEAALEEIEKNKGTLYDEAVVDTCLSLFREKGFKLEVT